LKKISDKYPGILLISVSVLVSIFLHAAFGLSLISRTAADSLRSRIVTFDVVERVAHQKQEILIKEPPPKPRVTKPIDLTKPGPKAPPPVEKPFDASKPVNNNPTKSQSPDFGVNPSLSSDHGSFAVRTGDTAMADPKYMGKGETGDGGEFNPLSVEKVTRLPELIADHKVEYPDEARKKGIEGKIILQIDIDKSGKVVGVKVMKGVGFGLDESAVSAAYKFKFKPAFSGDRTVPVRIRYTYSFVLEH